MHTNFLIHEKSPYLLQHAHNPVNWYSWKDDAFQKAQAEDKPIFLSIGYSTCHWCHVMEKESFEDPTIATLLNQNFISIKVDREERPDIDAVYMAACQAIMKTGGWPLTIFMTPDKKPFYAGTYFPKHNRYGTMGLMELLTEIVRLWQQDRKQLLHASEALTDFLNEQKDRKSANPEKALLSTAFFEFKQSFDRKNGGFGQAPKFPVPHNLLFLLHYFLLENEPSALQMVEKTLIQMARGGIWDQIGGGFSRYSTDEKWLIPHFEKMLYDNAGLIYVYLEAYHITNYPFYKKIAVRALDYVLRELSHPDGGFFCGQDADSEGVEGKYYVFTPEEISNELGADEGKRLCDWFSITQQGNFEGKNILNLLDNPSFVSTPSDIEADCEKLYNYRLKRTKLHLDDKILTTWNSLMFSALTKAYRILRNENYRTAAYHVHSFLKSHLKTSEGRLFLRWREGEAAHAGQLDDYAYYAYAVLESYQMDYKITDLQEAIQTAEWMVKLFSDDNDGGFFLYSSDAEQLITRPKEIYDGALPSGNSVAALVLVRLAKLTGEIKWLDLAEKHLSYLAGNITYYPSGHSFSLLAIAEMLYPSKELVIASTAKDLSEQQKAFIERSSLTALFKTKENAEALSLIAPFTANYPIPDRGDAYYLCQNGTCMTPVYQLADLEKIISL